ncbi:RNA polymerase sporulation sigma factor SigF [Clostridiisalibacter paucivorans]|uniref:RNA polymerase sporulation sigma factor SigF n=1 Tax=Clostridiisalibacter paucivorans TaxID=408753 RepID=UPI0004795D7F|nr:RNA polymerase sporulation sigma factor SigF [Clostridiisalibacter paucivorans]
MGGDFLEREENGLLTHDETMRLIARAQKGDKSAQTILLENNIGLIRSIVKRFSNRGHEGEDLFQLGSIGLIKAIDKFDTTYNVKFSTYAVPMIMGEIKRFLRDDGIIKVSRSLKQTANKAKATRERMFKTLGREPSIQEISNELDIDKEDIIMALESNANPEYLYDVIHHKDGSPIHLIDRIEGVENEDSKILDRITVKELIGRLKPRERQIIIMRYFEDKTQTAIAKKLGISQVQVSRIEKKVLNNMKKILNEN